MNRLQIVPAVSLVWMLCLISFLNGIEAQETNNEIPFAAPLSGQDRFSVVYKGHPPNHTCVDQSLRVAPNRDWVVVFMTGGVAEPEVDNHLRISRSTNQGRTWSDPAVVIRHAERAITFSEMIVHKDVMTLFITMHSGHFTEWETFTITSSNSGHTWSDPERFEPYPGRTWMRNLYRTTWGDWILPVQNYDYKEGAGELGFGEVRNHCENGALISSDQGKTWEKSNLVGPTPGFAENNVVELSDGRLVMLIRADGTGYLKRSVSNDGGYTWSDPELTRIPNPGVKFRLFRLRDGRIALIHNPNSRTSHPNARKARQVYRNPLSLWISDNDMQSWCYKRRLVAFPGMLAYPDGFVDEEDGYIHFVFDYNRHDVIYWGAKFPDAHETMTDFSSNSNSNDQSHVNVSDTRQPVPRVIFEPGPEYADENRKFGIASSITRTPGGRLWCGFSSGGTEEGHENYGVVVLSDDNGKTWSPPAIVFDTDGPGPIRSDHVTVWTAPTGNLWIMWSEYPEGLSGRHSSQWCMVSQNPDAEHPDWSNPRKLADEQNLLTTPTVLDDGTWIFPTGNWRCGYPSRPLISRNRGRSFYLGGPLRAEKDPDFDEYMIVERSDGGLVLFNRHADSFLQSESSDGGRTWTLQQPNGIPHTNARFVFMKLNSGNWLLVKHGSLDWVSDVKQVKGPQVGRTHLTAYVSRNEGKTWEGGLLLDERRCSYPFGFQDEDGSIYVSYERNRWNQPEILMATFEEADVLAGLSVSDTARFRVLINKATGSPPLENKE